MTARAGGLVADRRRAARAALLLVAALAPGCGSPLVVPRDEALPPLDAGARLVRLTPTGPVPAEVTLAPGDWLVFVAERPDAPLAVVFAGRPAREPDDLAGFAADADEVFTPTPLTPGATAALRCRAPGEFTAQVHAPDGSAAALRVVVAPPD
ncbi:MAG: hypothetical protein M9894_14440 [Planctomycetes bacterium]|nr:hypothetical protein [Planctomycetota bacterium]